MSRFMQRSFAYLVAGEQQLMQSLRRRNEDLMQTLDTLRQTRSELSFAQQLVRSDDLTGLANRRGLYRYLDESLALSAVGQAPGAAADRHRPVQACSTTSAATWPATRCCARSPTKCARVAGPLELPCRLGGDEFALLLRVADEGDLANRALGLIAGDPRACACPAARAQPEHQRRRRVLLRSGRLVRLVQPGRPGPVRGQEPRRRPLAPGALRRASPTPPMRVGLCVRRRWPRHRPFGVARYTRPPTRLHESRGSRSRQRPAAGSPVTPVLRAVLLADLADSTAFVAALRRRPRGRRLAAPRPADPRPARVHRRPPDRQGRRPAGALRAPDPGRGLRAALPAGAAPVQRRRRRAARRARRHPRRRADDLGEHRAGRRAPAPSRWKSKAWPSRSPRA